MANSSPKTSGIKRVQIGANVAVQLAAFGALFIMANYLGFKYFKRWDLSRSQKYTLASQTTNIIRSLKDTLRFIVIAPQGGDMPQDLTNLLKEYQYEGKEKVVVDVVDPYRDLVKGRELQAKYKFADAESLVIVDYQGRNKIVAAADMVDLDRSGEMFGQAPRVAAFKGEQALTSAMMQVVEDKANKIGFLMGHGEFDARKAGPTGTGGGPIQGIIQYVERQNVTVETLNLASVDKIPDDIGIVVIAGPKYDLSDREVAMLREYWNKKGRIFLALMPGASTPKLDVLLIEAGISPNNDRVLRTMSLGVNLVGVVKDVEAVFASDSPITKNLAGVNSYLLGGVHSLALDRERVQGNGIRLQNLILAGEGFWGETDYNAGPDAPVEFNTGKDHAAPVVIAVSAEKGGVENPTVKVESSRMIVVGSCGFLLDQALTQSNLDFFISSINWMLDRDESMSGVAPKQVETFALNLTQTQISTILATCMFVIPLTAAFVGAGVWWTRRR